ncbi:LysR family transcriptional regulator [Dryocola clanedunensis]|uniref:LysR family transcriptional regulator n=1 Tax=Cedecea sulfonylureivorans TaxID=3051154 RepID=UPI001928C222|nr:LysR family transcriptional regulator [Cedecea sulfonylureivorans]
MPIKMKQIQAFLQVSSDGNFTLAAEKLGITQSGLSRLLAGLESDLETLLFERHKHGVSLSEAGAAFLPHALTMMNTERKARQELALLNGSGKGIVRVGCVASFLSSHFIDKINSFHQACPDVHIKILDRIDSELFKLLLLHEIDLAVCGQLPHDEKVLARGKINFQDRFRIISRSDHPLQSVKNLSLHDLKTYDWIMPPMDSTPVRILSGVYSENNIPVPQPIVECASSAAIKSFICHTDLLTLMPAPIYRLEEATGLIKPLAIDNSEFVRDFHIYSHYGVLSGTSLKFIQFLKM